MCVCTISFPETTVSSREETIQTHEADAQGRHEEARVQTRVCFDRIIFFPLLPFYYGARMLYFLIKTLSLLMLVSWGISTIMQTSSSSSETEERIQNSQQRSMSWQDVHRRLPMLRAVQRLVRRARSVHGGKSDNDKNENGSIEHHTNAATNDSSKNHQHARHTFGSRSSVSIENVPPWVRRLAERGAI